MISLEEKRLKVRKVVKQLIGNSKQALVVPRASQSFFILLVILEFVMVNITRIYLNGHFRDLETKWTP
jgi:hypothetical protein